MKVHRNIFLFFTLLIATTSFAQEELRPLGYNDIIRAHWLKQQEQNQASRTASSVFDTLSLPFFDDFSSTVVNTDTTWWLSNSVYVNRDMPIAPITVGVATFDGVSATGCPYDTVGINPNLSVAADTLTSKPIFLQNFIAADSVYLSFYYEAQGRGDKPDSDDSLLLDFHNPDSSASVWGHVWGHSGYSTTQNTDSIFRLVMIRLDTAYLKRGFQFRFRNKSTPSGNVDQWHIDYVYLKNGRRATDTVFKDLAFVYNPGSFLKKYKAMPYKQYKATEMIDSLTNYIRNNDTTLRNINYYYSIHGPAQTAPYDSVFGAANLQSIFDYTYTTCISPSCRTVLRPPVSTPLPDPLTAPTDFDVIHVIDSSDTRNYNDTLHKKQIFANYYAYDDGTAEFAYGLTQAGGKIAYRFTLNYADTLRGLDMYFNWMPNGSTNNVSNRQFRITVWANNGGVPGNVIFQDSIVTPAYQYEYHNDWGNLTNTFVRFPLTSTVNLSGTFFVGWVQYGQDLLNIGLDRNTNSNSNMFFNTNGTWTNSTIPGSWMIRPLFGTSGEMQSVSEHQVAATTLELYPNPASDELFIRTSATNYDRITVSIFDAFGRMVIAAHKLSSNSIDISALSNGIYFVRIADEQGHPLTRKLIIAR